MATNFPTSLDDNAVLGADVANKTPVTDPLHNIDATFKNNSRDALKAVEAKVGVDSSAVAASHDYKIAQLEVGPVNPLIIKTGNPLATVTAPAARASVAIGHIEGENGEVKVVSWGSGFAFGYIDNGPDYGYSNIEVRGLGAFASGHIENTYDAYCNIYARDGCVASGFIYGDQGNATIHANNRGCHVSGYISSDDGGGSIAAIAEGSFAHGHVTGQGGAARVYCAGYGAAVFGAAYGSGSRVEADSGGAFASGFTRDGGLVIADGFGSSCHGYALDGGYIQTEQRGSFATGFADGANSVIYGHDEGCLASGWAAATGRIRAEGRGCHVLGKANDGDIRTWPTSHGALAGGYVDIYGKVYAHDRGTAAWGHAKNTDGKISARGDGAHAMGFADGALLRAGGAAGAGAGAFAGGFASGYQILAEEDGSFAFGAALTADIQATAINSFQFGEGVNALADTFQVGSAGLRLKGTVGVPSALQNGDVWVDASGNVLIRSQGASVVIA